MLIKKDQARKKETSEECILFEYDFQSKDLGFATGKINCRYPAKGKAMNKKSEQIFYVLSGSVSIHTDDGDFDLTEGDSFFFDKMKWYWFEAKDLHVAISNSPTWTFEQYEEK